MRRLIGIGAGMVLACGAGVAAASALTPAPPDPMPPEFEAVAVPGTDRIGASAPDPDSGPAWAVRSYTGASTRSCLSVARLEEEQFGPLIGGRVRPLPVDGSGSCADLSVDHVQPIVSRFAKTSETGARTVIFGRAEPDIHSVVVDEPSGTHTLTPDDDGTFLIVITGLLRTGAVRMSYRRASADSSSHTTL
jgi:hypothetical protein